MKYDEFLSIVRKFAVNNSKDDDIHGFKHVERVLDLCFHIGSELNANIKILKIAALLHDIGRKDKNNLITQPNHADLSAALAEEFLINNQYNLEQEELENILHCIKSHSFSNQVIPKTLEAKILSDADKLDALGAIGLYRTIGFTIRKGGSLNDVINHLEEKILKLKDQLYLDLSKDIAQSRNKIILDFYNEISDSKLNSS